MVKKCSKCKQELPPEEFYKNASRKDGRCDECKSCTLARRATQVERLRSRAREKTEKYKKVRARSKHAYQQTKKAKEAERFRKHRRRATYSEPYTLEQIHAEWHGLCVVCEEPVPLEQATIEHIIPIAKGGLNTPQNVGPSHSSCNSKMGCKAKSKPSGIVRVKIDPLKDTVLTV